MYFKNNFYSDGIDKFVVITVATEENENLARFRKSCSFYNVPYIVLGLGDNWNSGAAEDGVLLEPGGAQKIHYLREELKSWPDLKDHIVLFSDSYDVVFASTPQEIIKKFREMRAEIVFSTEKTCWPDDSLSDEYPVVESEYKFLNSGGFIGYADKILEVIDVEIPIEDDDQLFYTKVFLDNVEKIQIKEPKHYTLPSPGEWGTAINEYDIGSMSEPYFDEEIIDYLKTNYEPTARILDIGAGDGKWGLSLGHYFKHIDAVEAHENYVAIFNLEEIYANVFEFDIMDFEIENYDVLIMGDVFEHLSKSDCNKFLDKVKNKVNEIIIVVPYEHTNNVEYSDIYDTVRNEINPWGLHKQEDLTPEIMADRYPMLELMNWTKQPDSMEHGSGFGWYRYRRYAKDSHYIRLDYNQVIFQTLNQALVDVEQDDDGRFINLISGEKPCVIHANGPSWVKKYLKEKSFYMFGEYDGNLGSINLITKMHLPTDKQIYLSVFLHQEVSDINQVFDHIRFLDYPKKNILLHIVYKKEEDLYKIEKFISKHGSQYKDVVVTKNASMVETRQMVIHSAIGKCDFLFMLDENYVFRNNKSIQLLVEKNLGIIAPMIREEGTEWVNFTATPDFFQQRMKDYQSKTVFVVDYLTGIMVIHQDVLEKTLTFFEPVEEEQEEPFEDYNWDIRFCKNADLQNEILYVCNMNFYGSIIN
jgi:hypothetical protein